MKRIPVVLNLVLLAAVIVLCRQLWKKENTISTRANTASCVPCKDYSADPFTGIKLETAREMAALYKTNHYELYTAAKGVSDARSVWFSLDTLKKFIWAVENNLCRQDCGSGLNLGIRLYYAEYPADIKNGGAANRNPDYAPVKNTYAGMHTVFMVPTYYAGGYDWDFNPFSALTDCKPRRLTEYLSGGAIQANVRDTAFLKEKAMILFAGPDNVAQNHGNMIPPDNATGTAF